MKKIKKKYQFILKIQNEKNSEYSYFLTNVLFVDG